MGGSQALRDLEKRRCVASGAADGITVRQFGDTAMLIGEQINTSGGEPSVGVATLSAAMAAGVSPPCS